MKNKQFFWLPLLIFTGYAGLFVISCQHDTEQPAPKPLSDSPVDSRSCDNPSYCTCTVTTNADAILNLCGNMPQSSTNCTGCSSGDTGAAGAEFVANESKQFCVDQSAGGNLCITNTGSSSVDVTVRYGTSTPITLTIGASQTQCFHTDNCTTTESHCQ